MKKHWWKALGVLILLYVLTVGMLTPLHPGIITVYPRKAQSGSTLEVRINGYNTHFEAASGELSVWLKPDSTGRYGTTDSSLWISGLITQVDSDTAITATFDIPQFLPTNERISGFTLIADSRKDGAALLPGAIRITQDSVNLQAGLKSWLQDDLKKYLHADYRFDFPFRSLLYETIRNTYFHVSLWFAMAFLFIYSVVYSARYLIRPQAHLDRKANAFTSVGMLYGLLGLATGAVWAKYTWGNYWSWDIKQTMTAIALLIYGAYFVLRASFEEPEKKARLAAVYNLFAFAALIPLIYVIPRMAQISLHPGASGNPALGGEDLDNTMRLVFYPAIIGWTLIGIWMAKIAYRIETLQARQDDDE